jgi:secreted PhoX family phosphatase
MATLGRRKFIITAGAATLGLSLATLVTRNQARARGFGELIPDPDGILDLPEGFTYRILEQSGDDMDDGYRVPGAPDGMACFSGPNNTLILMRNHEEGIDGEGPYQAGQSPADEAYDPEAMGGVTRLVIDATTYERISSNLVLVGTIRNCAGGPSPWGWLSCEENTDINGIHRHGYTFVCPTDAESVQPPQRVDGYGRYNHEAVAVDPSNYYAYLTEDRGDSCLYRFVPTDMAEPFVGQLQALKVVGQDEFATTTMSEGEVVDVEWVDIDEPDPDDDVVRDEAQSKGAAIFVRGEGIWFFEGQVYICSTSGGEVGGGQIFRLIDGDTPTLELVVQSTDIAVLQSPDNITVAPWGEVFIAEDGDGDNFIRWVTAEGEICTFARNAASDSEFAGVCFSPDGEALFVNLQGDGLTLVVTGPFPTRMMPGDGDGDTTDGTDTTDGEGDTADGNDESTTTDGDSDGGTESDGDGTGDEIGDDSTDGTGTDAGVTDDGSGCSCNTTGEHTGLGTVVTGIATIAMIAMTRNRE